MSADPLATAPPPTPARSAWRAVWTGLRALLGFGLAGFLLYQVLHRSQVNLRQELTQAHWGWLAVALAAYGVVILVCFIRWRLLLAALDLHFPFLTVARLGMIGLFFNCVIPGAVGGDVVKMIYISQHAGPRTAEAVLTIMLDRVLGLFGLFIVAGAACLTAIPFLRTAPRGLQVATLMVGAACAAGLLAMLAVLFRETLQRWPGVTAGLAYGQRRLPARVTQIGTRLVAALDIYRERKLLVLNAILLSVGVHCLNALTLGAVGLGVRATGASLKHYFLAIQVGNSLGAIPVVPAGVGTRDYVVQAFLKAAGMLPEKAAAVAIVFTLVFTAWYLLGGPVFILARFRRAGGAAA